jgi:lysine 2,3-aminomutase
VRGTEHLRTPVERGLEIIQGLRGHTSGLGVPTFVIDVPGGGGKIPLQPSYVVSWTEDALLVRNYEGLTFTYRNPGAAAAATPAVAAASPRLERRRHRR